MHLGVLAALSLPSILHAYQIAFTGPGAPEDGYEYVTVDGSTPSPCTRTPYFSNGPLEVFVRARTPYNSPSTPAIRPFRYDEVIDTSPVPPYIALYSAQYPQLGSCNPRSLEQIIAFNKTARDVQLVAEIYNEGIKYWRAIVDAAEDAKSGKSAGRLIREYGLNTGEVLVRRPRRSGDTWDKLSGVVPTFGYDDNVFVRSLQEVEESAMEEGFFDDGDMTEVLPGDRWPRLPQGIVDNREAVRVRQPLGDDLDADIEGSDEDMFAIQEPVNLTQMPLLPLTVVNGYLPWEEYVPGPDESPLLSPNNNVNGN